MPQVKGTYSGISKAFERKGGPCGLVGLAELRTQLEKLKGPAIGPICVKAMNEASKPMIQRIRALAPAKTGRLRRAIRVVSGMTPRGSAYYRIVIDQQNFAGEEFYGVIPELWHGQDRPETFPRTWI